MGDQNRRESDSDDYRPAESTDEDQGSVRADGAGVRNSQIGDTPSSRRVAEHPTPVRMSAEWMRLLDERILELLATDGARSPAGVSERLTASGTDLDNYLGYVERRCEYLLAAGLLEADGDDYALSPRGERYLAGLLDAGTLPNPRHDH